MTKVHRVQCAEIWGGNRGDELMVETSGVRACLFSRACDGGKGGDIYYFSVCGSDLLTRIAIVDVMGHGKAVADTSQWLYDSLAARMNSADGNEVLGDLNRASVEKGYEAMSTATIAAFYRENNTLYFSYAGHHQLLFCKAGESTWRSLDAEDTDAISGLPLGVDEECGFSQQGVAANIGDRLFLYTDGLIEAMDAEGVQFSVERLLQLLQQFSNMELSAIREQVLESVLQHTGGNLEHDDVTFMVVEIAVSPDD